MGGPRSQRMGVVDQKREYKDRTSVRAQFDSESRGTVSQHSSRSRTFVPYTYAHIYERDKNTHCVSPLCDFIVTP